MWPENCQLIFTGGNQLGAPNQVSIYSLLPGHEADISVEMVSPMETGLYSSKWRMSTSQGNFFGGMYVFFLLLFIICLLFLLLFV